VRWSHGDGAHTHHCPFCESEVPFITESATTSSPTIASMPPRSRDGAERSRAAPAARPLTTRRVGDRADARARRRWGIVAEDARLGNENCRDAAPALTRSRRDRAARRPRGCPRLERGHPLSRPSLLKTVRVFADTAARRRAYPCAGPARTVILQRCATAARAPPRRIRFFVVRECGSAPVCGGGVQSHLQGPTSQEV
jgi:hypothetical protein